MKPITRLWKWMAAVEIAALVDIGVRFAMPFDLMRVTRVEAVLFPVTGVVLWRLLTADPAPAGWRRGMQWGLVAGFLLAGLRSALLAGGVAVQTANVIVAVTGLAWLATARIRRRPVDSLREPT